MGSFSFEIRVVTHCLLGSDTRDAVHHGQTGLTRSGLSPCQVSGEGGQIMPKPKPVPQAELSGLGISGGSVAGKSPIDLNFGALASSLHRAHHARRVAYRRRELVCLVWRAEKIDKPSLNAAHRPVHSRDLPRTSSAPVPPETRFSSSIHSTVQYPPFQTISFLATWIWRI